MSLTYEPRRIGEVLRRGTITKPYTLNLEP